MLLRALTETAPYLAIFALCAWVTISWILRSDSYQKLLEEQALGKNVAIKSNPVTNKSQVRPVFIIVLILTLFIAFVIACSNTIFENAILRQELMRQQGLLAKAIADNKAMEKKGAKIRGEVAELRAQKALYKAAIETIIKKDVSSR